MKQIKSIWAILSRPKVYWCFFSLLLAIIFWLLAVGDGDFRGTERIITLQVAVHNLPSDLTVVGSPEPVKVRITGLSPFLNRSEETISAYLDLEEAVEGTKAYGVEVKAPVGIEIISIAPRWMDIETEKIAEKSFPVTLALLGIPRPNTGGEARPILKPIPPTVTIAARRSILERVDHAVAYLSLGGDLARLEGSFPVQALDVHGVSLGEVVVDPPAIRVEVEAARGLNEEMDEEEPILEGMIE